MVACWCAFIYFFTLVFFQYIQCREKNMYVEWDVMKITAANYTVEFKLNP